MTTLMMKRTQPDKMVTWGYVLMLSAWGIVIACTSMGFLYVGYLLDKQFGTAPNFMFGLFFLAVVTSIGRLYQEAWKKKNQV